MSSPWPVVPLGAVLRHRKEFIRIDDLKPYKRCRVQLHAQGVVLRDTVAGAEIKTKTQQECKAGEFLVAEIDAKHGGYGIVPEDLSGAIVSSHYFLFGIDKSRLDRRFLGYFIRTPSFREQVEAQGSTNYAAIRPSHVLNYTAPLPPLAEQRRIVARIEALAERIAEGKRLKQHAIELGTAGMTSAVRGAFSSLPHEERTIEECCSDMIDYRGRTPPICDDGIPHLTSANIKNGHIDWHTTKFVSEDTYEAYMTRGLPVAGDVIFTMEAPLGEAAVVPDNRRFSLAQRTLLLRGRPDIVSGPFLGCALTAPDVRAAIYAKATGTTVKGIASKRLRQVKIPVIPLPQQAAFVARLAALRATFGALRAAQDDTSTELDALLPAVLAEAFAGRL